MCTVTIKRDADSVCVTMNRDEQRDRSEAGLSNTILNNVAMAFPQDGLSKGTWIGVGQQGVILCLMNRYDQAADPAAESRGNIIPDALAKGDFTEIIAWLEEGLAVATYNPFTLFVISMQHSIRFDWTGQHWHVEQLSSQVWYMATSSSEDSQQVSEYRAAQFDRWLRTRESYNNDFPLYHFQHDHQLPRQSVLVSRPKVHTKSITQVVMTSQQADIKYLPEDALTPYFTVASEAQALVANRHTLPIL